MSSRVRGRVRFGWVAAAAAAIVGCASHAGRDAEDSAAPSAEALTSTGGSGGTSGSGGTAGAGATGGFSGAALELRVLTNSCGSNQAQQFFQVVNHGTTTVKLSDLSIRYWIDDTTGKTLSPQVAYGGCVTGVNGNPSCVHPAAGVTESAKAFSPASGPDANHQANWELTLTTTDGASLAPNTTWDNIQTTFHLTNSANFVPGSARWFSPCLHGSTYAADPHFALYYQGKLVFSSGGVTAPDSRAPHGTQQLQGYVSSAIHDAQLVGPLPSSTLLDVSIGIPVRDTSALHAYYKQISDLTNPLYGKVLSPAAFTAAYSPSETTYQQVVSWAQTHHFTVVKTYPTRTLLRLRGTVADIEQAFYVNIVNKLRPDGSAFFAPDREPSTDLGVSVLRISGLENYDRSKPLVLKNKAVITGPSNSLSGTDFRNIYLPDPDPASTDPNRCTALDGSGQGIGIMAPGGADFDDQDILSYEVTRGLPQNSPKAWPSDAHGTTPRNRDAELTGDLSMAVSMAPGAEVTAFQASSSYASDTISILAEMANYNFDTSHLPIYQFSASFSLAIDQNALAALESMAAMGQSFFIGSGDWGAYDSVGTWTGPASDLPFTTVGMTSVIAGSTAEDPMTTSGAGILSGPGGAPLPDYQSGLNLTTLGGSTQYRNVPDVTLSGHNISFLLTQTGTDGQLHTTNAFFDGTSLSSPLWAGFMALINQRRLANSLPPVGFANPAFYRIGKDAALYMSTFNDVVPPPAPAAVTGVHRFSQAANGDVLDDLGLAFPSAPGYDLASGWGSPQCGLIDNLSGPTVGGVCSDTARQCGWRWPGGYSCATGGCDLDSGCCTDVPPDTCPVVSTLAFTGTPLSGCAGATIVSNIHVVSWDAKSCHYVGDQSTASPCTTTTNVGPYTFVRPRLPTCGFGSSLACQPNSDGGFSCGSGTCNLTTGCCQPSCADPSLQCDYSGGGATCPNDRPGTPQCDLATGCCQPPSCPVYALRCQPDANGKLACVTGGDCNEVTGCCPAPTCKKQGKAQCSLDNNGVPSCLGCDGEGCCEGPQCSNPALQCFDESGVPTCPNGNECNSSSGCCDQGPPCIQLGTILLGTGGQNGCGDARFVTNYQIVKSTDTQCTYKGEQLTTSSCGPNEDDGPVSTVCARTPSSGNYVNCTVYGVAGEGTSGHLCNVNDGSCID